ncbi:MAG: twin-arginine translocase TatA/TatE family subunit [Chthoniobacteraceae bacterium]
MSIPFTPVFANIMGPQGLFILFVLLLLFGAKKLPELARGLGQAIREFSKAKNEITDEIMRESTPRIEPPPSQSTATSQPVGTQQSSAPGSPVDSQHHGTHA